jgi:spermidine/putrescine transport system ATP-binding protein
MGSAVRVRHFGPGTPGSALRMSDTVLDIRNVTKRFGTVTAVQNVNLEIERGEFFSLLGPSGCGKTTLLRMIAGFEEITEGQIFIHGEDVAPLPPYKRPVNTVFQHYSLFPHMNVFQNIAFGLERKNTPKNKIETTVKDALDLVQLAGFEKRRPSQLSGGQKQRVALARALVMQPEVLLLDEPLGALDMKLRKEMQVELKNLQEQLKITFIFVTHDQEEALVMSDRIAVMNQGKIEQVGKSCSEIYEHPRTEFVANFIGSTNIFEGVLRDRILKMNGGPEFQVDSARQGPVRFTVRPEKMLLSPQEVAGRISIPVVVTDEIFQGTNTSWVVDFHGQKYTVIEQNTKVVEEQGRFSRGDQALLSWNPKHTVILES